SAKTWSAAQERLPYFGLSPKLPQLSPAWRHSRCIVNVSYFRPAILQASGPNAARRWFDAARCGDHRDRVDPRPFRQRATVGDARLVEMDMRLNQPGTDEPPGGVILDSDIEEALIEPINETAFRTIRGPSSSHRKPARHSMTSLARASRFGGISSASVFAVFKLMTSSSFVGCSTGRSPGFAPLKILSIMPAAR